MKNTIANDMNGILTQAMVAADGAAQHGADINLLHNTAANLAANRTEAVVTRDAHETAKQTLRNRRTEMNTLREQARRFAMLARDNLKPSLGREYSESWDAAGFVGSLATPQSVDDLILLLESLAAFYTGNPAQELPPRNLTAAQAQALFSGLSEARASVNIQETAVDTLLAERNAKFSALRKRLRGLVTELEQLIDPLDGRWLAFGLNKPGADETPAIPQNVKALLIGNNAIAVKWEPALRAEYYRVWKRITGVDQEWIAVGNPADLDFTIEALPANSNVEIAVSALNNGGESAPSEAVKVTTH